MRDANETDRIARRTLLTWALASPLLALPGSLRAAPRAARTLDAPRDAVDVFDFERAAEAALHPGHRTYLSMGVQGERTLRANREAFDHFALRPRRLVDVRDVDTRTSLLGTDLPDPIVLAPIGSQAAYHADAERAVARAAGTRGQHMILSQGTSTPLEDVATTRGAPIWSQLYAQRTWPLTRSWIRDAESSGCSALVLTVDIVGLPTGRDRLEKLDRTHNPDCAACHGGLGARAFEAAEAGLTRIGIDARGLAARSMMLDWEVIDRIRDATALPLVVKGLLVPEDAEQAIAHGIDAIVVSNHGGRAEDHGLASIEALAEIAPAVAGRIPILVDSGFRRGTDVVAALALGATAVCVGRPYVWGLAAFGQAGVEGVLELMRRELIDTMRQLGRPTIESIDTDAIRRVRGS